MSNLNMADTGKASAGIVGAPGGSAGRAVASGFSHEKWRNLADGAFSLQLSPKVEVNVIESSKPCRPWRNWEKRAWIRASISQRRHI